MSQKKSHNSALAIEVVDAGGIQVNVEESLDVNTKSHGMRGLDLTEFFDEPVMHQSKTSGLNKLHRCCMLRFNLVRVEIRELRPEVVAESDEVLVHYRSRTNV